jgi:16S rRNA (uracil1498-N3)-methyltransferase
MPIRLYHSNAIQPNTLTPLTPEASHHVATVMRAKVGTSITLFDGVHPQEHAGTLQSVSKKSVMVQLASTTDSLCESPRHIHLIQALGKQDKMEWVIQKSTELGVSTITPLISERSQIKLNTERAAKKQQHWHKVAVSACEQCGRCVLPELSPVTSWRDMLATVQADVKLILAPGGDVPFMQSFDTNDTHQSIAVLIGPEGGFSETEMTEAVAAGFVCVSLGHRILRTETAPVAILGAIQL